MRRWLYQRENLGRPVEDKVMSLRYIGSGWQAESKFAVVPRFDVILREPFSDFSGSAANDRILIGVVVRLPVKNIDTESAFLQAVEAALHGRLDDMPKKTGTLPASAKLRTS
jgi:hypothetical protein